MIKKSIIYIIGIIGWLPMNRVCAQVLINELMQSNVDCIMDDLNEFPDSWVELYNAGDAPVNLRDYRLGVSDKPDDGAWQLPDKTLAPRQYAVVYCDKQAQGMHTDFRLETANGCEVWLFNGQTVSDKVTGLKKQPAPNIAYGRKTDGSEEKGYQTIPTPGAANCGEVSDQVLGDPVFSELGKVVTDGQSLTIELTLPKGSPEGTEIYMTVDGSEPTRNSMKYTSPLTVSNTKIVRARLFCDGWLSPRSVTQSYIFHPRQMTLPVVCIATDKRYLNDSKIGIYVDGSYQAGKKNYEFNWRRPMNIELFEEAGQPSVINQLCEARVAGGATRGAKLKTLAVYAHKRFGKKHLEYEFFPDQKPGICEFKSIMLRNSGNDFDYLYMRDPIIQRTMASHVDLDWQAWQPAIIYINGVYRGILNIRERSNEDNIWSNYQKLEDIDMVENWRELKAGSWDHYNQFMAFCKEQGHTLAEYEQWMDCSEYADLMLANLYFNNLDTPGNNWMMWRPRTEDGRWRFVAKDMDYTMGLYGDPVDYKIIEWLYNPNFDGGHNWGANSYDGTRIFRRLMDDPDFFRLFIDRATIYMGDFLNEKGVSTVWNPMYDYFKTEFTYHRRLYMQNPWWPRDYKEEMRDVRNWLTRRTNLFYQQLGNYYQLGSPISLTVNAYKSADIRLTFNGIPLSQGSFDGQFFKDREVTLEGVAPEGQVVKGWKILTVTHDGNIETRQVDGAQCSFTMPSCSSLAVDAILADATAIETVDDSRWSWHKDGQRLFLTGVPAGTSISLYDLRGMRLLQITADGTDITLPLTKERLHILKVGSQSVKL